MKPNERYSLTDIEDEEMPDDDENEDDLSNEERSFEGILSFMTQLKRDLTLLRNLLRDRNRDLFKAESRHVLKTCDSMLSACLVFLGWMLNTFLLSISDGTLNNGKMFFQDLWHVMRLVHCQTRDLEYT